MYYISKELEIASAHKLNLNYESKCKNLHGHNWKVKVFCKSETLNENGMIIDYSEIKKIVDKLDHNNLNDILNINTTAENLCKYICDEIPFCYRVEICEASKSWAAYEKI